MLPRLSLCRRRADVSECSLSRASPGQFRSASRRSNQHARGATPSEQRQCAVAAAAAPTDARARSTEVDDDVEAAVRASVDLVHEIVREVCSAVMTAESVSYLGAGDETAGVAYHAKCAVEPRVHRFSHITLLTLDDVMASPAVQRQPRELEILRHIKAEALRQVGGYLQPEVRLLERVCECRGRERQEVLEGLPQDELQALALCAGQVASEMEEPDAIADVRLLCTVAAAHEAMHAVLATKATAEKPAERPQRAAGVPRGVAAFVKELVPLSDQVARRGKILSALKEGIQPPPKQAKRDKSKPGLYIPPEAAKARAAEAARSEAESTPDAPRPVPPPLPNPPTRGQDQEQARAERVRPASLLQCIDAIRREVAANPPRDVAANPAQLQARLQEIQVDCLAVVEELAVGRHWQT